MSQNESIALSLDKREVLGKSVKHLRKQGLVPAVIHDHGKDSHIVMGDYNQIYKAYLSAGKHHPIDISVGKSKYTALIKVVEFDPKHNTLSHIVFNAVDANSRFMHSFLIVCYNPLVSLHNNVSISLVQM